MVSVDVKPKVDIVDAESSRDCVSEEVSGALPSLISLMVSVDVKHYVLLLHSQTPVQTVDRSRRHTTRGDSNWLPSFVAGPG